MLFILVHEKAIYHSSIHYRSWIYCSKWSSKRNLLATSYPISSSATSCRAFSTSLWQSKWHIIVEESSVPCWHQTYQSLSSLYQASSPTIGDSSSLLQDGGPDCWFIHQGFKWSQVCISSTSSGLNSSDIIVSWLYFRGDSYEFQPLYLGDN